MYPNMVFNHYILRNSAYFLYVSNVIGKSDKKYKRTSINRKLLIYIRTASTPAKYRRFFRRRYSNAKVNFYLT